jgi:hypothetical protein
MGFLGGATAAGSLVPLLLLTQDVLNGLALDSQHGEIWLAATWPDVPEGNPGDMERKRRNALGTFLEIMAIESCQQLKLNLGGVEINHVGRLLDRFWFYSSLTQHSIINRPEELTKRAFRDVWLKIIAGTGVGAIERASGARLSVLNDRDGYGLPRSLSVSLFQQIPFSVPDLLRPMATLAAREYLSQLRQDRLGHAASL